MVRVSMVQGIDWEHIDKFLDVFSGIACIEVSEKNKLHMHAIVSVPFGAPDVRQTIKNIWPEAMGNKCLYVRPSKDVIQSMKYVVKDGNIHYTWITKEFIDDLLVTSKKKIDIKKEIKELEDAMILGTISFEEFQVKYILLKASVGPLYSQHIIAYFRGLAIQYGHVDIYNYVSNINDALQH